MKKFTEQYAKKSNLFKRPEIIIEEQLDSIFYGYCDYNKEFRDWWFDGFDYNIGAMLEFLHNHILHPPQVRGSNARSILPVQSTTSTEEKKVAYSVIHLAQGIFYRKLYLVVYDIRKKGISRSNGEAFLKVIQIEKQDMPRVRQFISSFPPIHDSIYNMFNDIVSYAVLFTNIFPMINAVIIFKIENKRVQKVINYSLVSNIGTIPTQKEKKNIKQILDQYPSKIILVSLTKKTWDQHEQDYPEPSLIYRLLYLFIAVVAVSLTMSFVVSKSNAMTNTADDYMKKFKTNTRKLMYLLQHRKSVDDAIHEMIESLQEDDDLLVQHRLRKLQTDIQTFTSSAIRNKSSQRTLSGLRNLKPVDSLLLLTFAIKKNWVDGVEYLIKNDSNIHSLIRDNISTYIKLAPNVGIKKMLKTSVLSSRPNPTLSSTSVATPTNVIQSLIQQVVGYVGQQSRDVVKIVVDEQKLMLFLQNMVSYLRIVAPDNRVVGDLLLKSPELVAKTFVDLEKFTTRSSSSVSQALQDLKMINFHADFRKILIGLFPWLGNLRQNAQSNMNQLVNYITKEAKAVNQSSLTKPMLEVFLSDKNFQSQLYQYVIECNLLGKSEIFASSAKDVHQQKVSQPFIQLFSTPSLRSRRAVQSQKPQQGQSQSNHQQYRSSHHELPVFVARNKKSSGQTQYGKNLFDVNIDSILQTSKRFREIVPILTKVIVKTLVSSNPIDVVFVVDLPNLFASAFRDFQQRQTLGSTQELLSIVEPLLRKQVSKLTDLHLENYRNPLIVFVSQMNYEEWPGNPKDPVMFGPIIPDKVYQVRVGCYNHDLMLDCYKDKDTNYKNECDDFVRLDIVARLSHALHQETVMRKEDIPYVIEVTNDLEQNWEYAQQTQPFMSKARKVPFTTRFSRKSVLRKISKL